LKAALDITRALCNGAGFDQHVVVDVLLEAAIRRRMRTMCCTDLDEYALVLAQSRAEQAEILEELLIRESWFFRDQGPFRLLTELIATRWCDRSDRQPLRILSAPCAGGEEPYSIAMALAGQGVPLDRFVIDAVDLSRRGLEQANSARYSRRAMRGVPAHLRERYLDQRNGERVEVVAELRGAVRFHQGNLLDLPDVLGGRPYQAVFSRNALIYMDATARDTVLTHLRNLLAADGVLFVGHVETALLRDLPLLPFGPPEAFAFEHRRVAEVRPSGVATMHAKAATSPKPSVGPSELPATRLNPSATATGPRGDDCSLDALIGPDLDQELAAVRLLADRGRYELALPAAKTLVARAPDLAEGHHLVGLILAAQGVTAEARRAFERALYLDPLYLPSLEHLALLLDALGNPAYASRLRLRAARIGSKHE
jgi:chemotaxis protein methyltransferase WspC